MLSALTRITSLPICGRLTGFGAQILKARPPWHRMQQSAP
jgi:hypothetical protein